MPATARFLSRRLGCASLPSVDLAGRRVAISRDVPAAFDATLAPHHKLIGRWVAARGGADGLYTRTEARALIEKAFDQAVIEILSPFNLADLRAVVLAGDETMPPAIAIICDTMGQLDLGWIEQDNPLRVSSDTRIAPLRWRAAAYQALSGSLNKVLPVFGYDDMREEYSMYYWDGATTDAEAIRHMLEYQGMELEDIDEDTLPSRMDARRPRWMLAENAGARSRLPAALRRKIDALQEARKAVAAIGPDGNAWHFDFDLTVSHLPGFEDCSHLPALTIVPAEQFGRELDTIGDHGMQQGFMDIAGICPLPGPGVVDAWFASLRVGMRLLAAAQDLINIDPKDIGA